jgi:AraC-like DNA-binding protein
MADAQRTPAIHSFPAGQALQLVELTKSWGVEPDRLLGPFGFDEARLAQPGARVPLDVQVALTERARSLTGEPGLGIYLGLQKSVSAYGFVGFAAMSAATVGEAWQQAVELTPSLTTAVSLSLNVVGDTAAIVVREQADVGSIRDVALFSLFVGLRQMTKDLTGRQPAGRFDMVIDEPEYYARFVDVLPQVRFGQPLNQLLLPAAALQVPLLRPDRAAMQLARQQCLDQMARLGFAGSLPGQVRRLLVDGTQFRSVEQVAAALAMSERTLKRRLAEQGSSYTRLLREEREAWTLQLLGTTDLSLDEIADRVGYANASSLARAFSSWTGQTPAAYRRNLRERALLG